MSEVLRKCAEAIKERNEEQLEERNKKFLEDIKHNPNNMSFWLNAITNLKLNVPKTTILSLDFMIKLPSWDDDKKREILKRNDIKTQQIPVMTWLMCDCYFDEDVEEFTKLILTRLKDESTLNPWIEGKENGARFLKTGNFSNKFDFDNCCRIDEPRKIGRQFLNMMYAGMCMGCTPSPELVIRDFIETEYDRPQIYNGMKLNTEYRVFYDFENNKILGLFNYWDRQTMESGLYDPNDQKVFTAVIDEIEADFEKHKELVIAEAEKLKDAKLRGVWSADFLWTGRQVYLIDMALGQSSYYYDRVANMVKRDINGCH